MKLLIQQNRVVATATDDYDGPEQYINAPADFDLARMGDYVYDGTSLSLPPDTRITRLAFRNRFTQAEKVMLELAALDDPTAPMTQRQQAAAIRVYLADVAASTFVDLARQDTRGGVHALESYGLIAPGRSAEILDSPILASERYVS